MIIIEIFERGSMPTTRPSSRRSARSYDACEPLPLIHVLPKRFRRIRHYGLFANARRASRRAADLPAPMSVLRRQLAAFTEDAPRTHARVLEGVTFGATRLPGGFSDACRPSLWRRPGGRHPRTLNKSLL
jgi:hypothetical protein